MRDSRMEPLKIPKQYFNEIVKISELYHNIAKYSQLSASLLGKYKDGEAEELRKNIALYKESVPEELKKIIGLGPLIRRLEIECALVRLFSGEETAAIEEHEFLQ